MNEDSTWTRGRQWRINQMEDDKMDPGNLDSAVATGNAGGWAEERAPLSELQWTFRRKVVVGGGAIVTSFTFVLLDLQSFCLYPHRTFHRKLLLRSSHKQRIDSSTLVYIKQAPPCPSPDSRLPVPASPPRYPSCTLQYLAPRMSV